MNVWQMIKERMKADEKYAPEYAKKNSGGIAPRTPGGKKRGIGYTRRSHEQSKVRRLMERVSRKINYQFQIKKE